MDGNRYMEEYILIYIRIQNMRTTHVILENYQTGFGYKFTNGW